MKKFMKKSTLIVLMIAAAGAAAASENVSSVRDTIATEDGARNVVYQSMRTRIDQSEAAFKSCDQECDQAKSDYIQALHDYSLYTASNYRLNDPDGMKEFADARAELHQAQGVSFSGAVVNMDTVRLWISKLIGF